MIGRFHELSLATRDIRATAEFYEALRFTHATTNDTWCHPYGVLTDGDLCIGIHGRVMPSPALSFVLPGLAHHVRALEALQIPISSRHLGSEEFNTLDFADPGGQAVRLIEARTYSPLDREQAGETLCGRFDALSLPERDPESAAQFWERLGFKPLSSEERPWPCARLEGAGLRLELHRSRTADLPVLIFRASEMDARIQAIRSLGLESEGPLPRGLDPRNNLLLETPEGIALLLLGSETRAG